MNKSFDKVRTRIAPSPTGNLHLGTVRTALYNQLFAHRHGGEFYFRLEDTDRERSKEEFTQEIQEGFKWLGVEYDGEMIRQSELASKHQQYIDRLMSENKAYKCYASPEELDEMRKQQRAAKKPEGYDNRGRDLTEEQIKAYEAEDRKFVVRLNLGESRDIQWKDLVRGEMSVNTKDLGGDPVIQKFNGQILYNFAVACDDYDMKISHVFRGEDHLTNTAKQIAVFEALGFPIPEYGHLPLIFTKDKQKLSKRKHGDIAGVAKYQQEGYLPEALANYLIATSYTAPDAEQELYTLDEATKTFEIAGVSKSPAIYDIKKLNWFNSQYIKAFDHNTLMGYLKPFLTYDFAKFSEADQAALLEAVRGNLNKFDEIDENISYFYDEIQIPEDLKKFIDSGSELLRELMNRFDNLDFTNPESMKASIDQLGADLSLKGKNLYFPVRIAVSGRNHGPDLGFVFYLLGKDKVRERIEAALNVCKN